MHIASRRCPVCRSELLYEVLHWPNIPANSALFFRTEAEARRHPRGSLRLAGCNSCGFLFNADVDESLIEYSARSIETQAWSEHFSAFSTSLASDWVAEWDLSGKTTLEIGCGRHPTFLELMCSFTGRRGIGIDPALDISAEADLELIADRFDHRFVDLQADAVVCRHTLEHIVDVAAFLGDLREWAHRHPQAVFLFEVPDAERILQRTTFWDVYYEHCSYFGPCSLRQAFTLHGFAVHEVRRVYDDQYLILAARAGDGPARAGGSPCGAEMRMLATAFGVRTRAATKRMQRVFASLAAEGPLVVWQAGAKIVGLLAATDASRYVTALADANPDKHGLFIVGSGLPIVGADEVRKIGPKHVVLMNEVYVDEVRATLAGAGVDAHLHTANDLLGVSHTMMRSQEGEDTG